MKIEFLGLWCFCTAAVGLSAGVLTSYGMEMRADALGYTLGVVGMGQAVIFFFGLWGLGKSKAGGEK